MPEIIILLGTGRSGKTTYAHKIEKEKGYEYISFDKNYHYTGEKEFFIFLDFLADGIGSGLNDNKDKNFIMDGYQYFNGDNNFKYLKSKLKFHKIRSIVVFENYNIIQSRGKGAAERVATREEILNEYKIIQKYAADEFVRSSDYYEAKIWEEVMGVIGGATEQEIKNFLKIRI